MVGVEIFRLGQNVDLVHRGYGGETAAQDDLIAIRWTLRTSVAGALGGDAPGLSEPQKLLQLERIRRSRALLVVVEKDEDVAALLPPRSNAARPFRKRLRAVVVLVLSAGAMSANVDEVGGTFPRRRRVVMVREAKRDVALRKLPQDRILIPARMPKFEAVATLP
jgi:hypothetical protein